MELPLGDFALIAIYLTIIVLTLYGAALGYHMLTYGEKRTTALTTILIYAIGAIVLIIGLFTTYSLF